MSRNDALKWDDSETAGVNARRRLPELVRSYYQEGRRAACDETPQEALHQFRLRTKRVRYTVELFRLCYGPGLERWLASLREIQDHLGAISDCATTRQLGPAALAEGSVERQRLESYLDQRAAREESAFRRYWRDVFDKSGEARRWETYFRRKTG
jgi:CHAD domain-containing protein